MKIRLNFLGFPEVESVIGGKEINLEFEGRTYGELLTYLQNTYGESIMKTLWLQVLRNGKEWIKRNDLTYSFQDGDQLTFLRMVSGG
jgi:hypothetical protein